MSGKSLNLEEESASMAYRSASQTSEITRNIAILLLLVATCLGLGLALVNSRAIARPLARLVRGTEAIGRGDLDTRIEVGAPDEIGELGNAFNAMAGDLQESDDKRRQAEDELRLSEERFRDVATSMSDWIWEPYMRHWEAG